MIRVAAVGDIHVGPDVAGRYREQLAGLAGHADVLLVAGDLTRHGTVAEGRIAVEELSACPVPVIAVLGNHDYHSDAQEEITALLREAGVTVLEGDWTVLECAGVRLGVAGGKGFGGGFAGRSAGEFGEPEMKEFVRHTREFSERLHAALTALDEHGADVKIALTHYSPVKDTLAGEPLEIYPFLGSYLMAEAIDRAEADLAVHGHAHRGAEKGMTAGGVRVRNVALPVIRHAYAVYSLDETTLGRPVRSASLSR
ncbi:MULTISPECIES: metallophosphoesterase family protein [Thermomonospora]|uniref:Metallophosphoesterase n=1 Tax=Thermomonospora curvata (strain ATCC 19995 / DSM 43183 / JCM 3096 / KCTC 9072 / NBRC 15933 / NCIMB 10081 / Henssen B9) TaxID=471852 RepID=D1A3P3_THECD|nr:MULTISPECIES: metallophosphoesterase [Thermomonospora]ACY96168.1 metallophosphoesterase [Thermomonospora curvata DSM 43183]PKK15601.1 MAG: metallophosphoesterase [Thermomonospora sp. CIF 1]